MQNETCRIANYLLGKTIGKGTFGKVKEAIHIPTNQRVAIKLMSKTKIEDDEEDKERLLREIDILRVARHPNIIQLYQIIQTDEDICIVIEYAEKGQLFKLISRQQKLKQQSAGRLFIQLMNAVEYLHRQGISHRDLKPQNILLDFDYNVKLIDFGLSNYYKVGGDNLETACGSPCYAPPEMVSGNTYNGFKTDVWSMGIIFYVMITGFLPFEDKTTKQLYLKIISGKYSTIPEHVSEQAKEIIQRTLVTDPQQRISLEQLRNLKFFDKIKPLQPYIRGLVVGINAMPIDMQLLEEVKKYNKDCNTKELQQDLRFNRHTPNTTIYYLLQKQVLKQGNKTTVDLQIYLESTYQPQKQQQLSPLNRDASPDEINFVKRNKSLMKKKPKKKQPTGPKNKISTLQSTNDPQTSISPIKKFKFRQYNCFNKDYTKRIYRSLQKEDKRRYHSLTNNQKEFRMLTKKVKRLNSQSKSKPKNPQQQLNKTPPSKPSKSLIQQQSKDINSKKQKLKTQISSTKIPLATKVWNAYFKNSLHFKPKEQGKSQRLNLKQKQKLQIFRQNLRQLKEGFTRLPQIQTERKQDRQRSAQKLLTARK